MSKASNRPEDAPLPEFPEEVWRGTFGQYKHLVRNVEVVPMPFHYANFLAVVAAEMGDWVRLAEGIPTFTNFFIFCCGRTGTKKSIARGLVTSSILSNLLDPRQAHVISSISSGEGLIRTLMANQNVLLRYDEIKDLLVTAQRAGTKIESTLCEGFDLDVLQTIVKRSKESLLAKEYFFNFIANGTPAHVNLDMSESFFKGGMLNRFLVFAGKPTGVIKEEIWTPELEEAQTLARHISNHAADWRGLAMERGRVRVGMSDEARAVFSVWNRKFETMLMELPELQADPLTRLNLHAKKLAALYCVLESPPSMKPLVTAGQMTSALAAIEYCRASMEWITSSWAGVKSAQQQSEKLSEERIEAYIHKHGCVEQRELYRCLHMSNREVAKTVNSLVDAGVVTVTGERPRMVHDAKDCKCEQGTDES